MLKRLLLTIVISLCLTQSAIAYPKIPFELDYQCAMQTYGHYPSNELDKKVEERIKELTSKALFLFGVDIGDALWEYGIDQPMAAGVTYDFGPGLILFNPIFLNKYKEEFIDIVVRHEISHVIQNRLYPQEKESHGNYWKYIMKELGDKNLQVYHNYTLCADNFPPSILF